MSGEPKAGVRTSQIIWVVACVVLLTSLFLIGAWLFKPGEGPPGSDESSLPSKGGITEQTVNAAGFAQESGRPPAPSAAPAPSSNIPVPAALASRAPVDGGSRGEATPPSPAPAPKETKIEPSPAPAAPASKKVEARATPKESAVAERKGETPAKTGSWQLQVAAVSDKKRAQELQKQLKAKGFPEASVVRDGNLYKVRIAYRDEGGARAAKKKLTGGDLKEAKDAFIVKPEK